MRKNKLRNCVQNSLL